MNTSSNTPSGLPMTTLSRRIFIIGTISSVVGCTSMDVQQVLDSPEKMLQKKFGGMPLIFGTKSNKVPDDVMVTPSKHKKGTYVLHLPHLSKITRQEFEVDATGNIVSDVIEISITPFDIMATAIATKLNLTEGERYKVTIEGGTLYVRVLSRSIDVATTGSSGR